MALCFMSEQESRPISTTKQWIHYALGDLGVAEREILYESPAYHTICFLCQSATEKLLKGFLIYHGWELKKTHDIVALLALCAEYDDDLARMVDQGIILNEYIIAGRYPEDLAYEQLGTAEAREALQAAHNIRDRIMDLLREPLGE